jgi:hypothetical protein
MGIGASWVRVYWQEDVPGGRPPRSADARRLVVAGPGVPTTSVALVRVPAGERPSGGDGFADEHLVAEADPGSPWSKVADVLIVRGPPEWTAPLLAYCPGRLVTAFDGRRRESLLDVAGQGLARLRPLAADRTGGLWPYASFVHAWTVAGRPLGALHDACLTEAASRRGVRVSVVGRSRVWPVAS